MISDPRTSEKWKCDFEGDLDGDLEGDLEGDQVEEEPPCEEDGGCEGHVEAAEEQVGDREVDYEDGGRVPHLEDDQDLVVVDNDDDNDEVEKQGDNCGDDDKEGGQRWLWRARESPRTSDWWSLHCIVVPLPQVLLLIIGYLVVFFDQSDQSIANLAVNIYHLVSLYLATNSDGSIFCLSFCIPPDILHDTDTFSPIHHQPIPFYRT